MENNATSSHSLLNLLYAAAIPLATALGALTVKIYQQFSRRGLTQAQIHKTNAETRQLDGDTLGKAYDRIDELLEVNIELVRRNALQVIELSERDRQVNKLLAILKINEIKYSDYDHIK